MTHLRHIHPVVASLVRRSIHLIALALLVGAGICLAPEANAAQTPVAAAAPAGRESDAAAISAGVAKTTGLAISPLVVLVALGWYDFLRVGGFDAAPGALPIHANPWILIPFTIILGCVIAKKFASPAVPLPIRKVLDTAEYVEAKFSALIAAGLLLPTIVGAMAAAAGSDAPGNTQVASLIPDPLLYALILIAVVGIFVSVWITFHVIDALIVLSPFAIVDAALVALRGSVLAVLGLGLLISPFLGLALALPLIVASVFFAGWCIRLDLFALVTAGDILFRRAADPYRPARVFVAARGYGVPIRTMGHAVPSARGARFSYRPMFVFPRRAIDIPYSRPVLVRGAIWSTMRDDASDRAIFACPPRFNRVATSFAAHFGAVERDGFLRRGWRELRTFFGAIFGRPVAVAA